MDTVGQKAARKLVSMLKVAAPNMGLMVMDRAIQVHGGIGMSYQFPLGAYFARTRSVKFMDGPDSSHEEVVAKLELRKRELTRSRL